jgi:hypothetical protein
MSRKGEVVYMLPQKQAAGLRPQASQQAKRVVAP